MARTIRSMGFGCMGLALGLAAAPLSAQSIALPASDPVGIARAGTGVAYGRSLEAAALNPALLVTLQDRVTAYLASGVEMQSSQTTLQANQKVVYSSDRNAYLPAFGAGWKLGNRFTFGLKLDEPFSRHGQIDADCTARFLGDSIDLKSRRLEAQFSWAVSDGFSLGIGAGAARLDYSMGYRLRALVPKDGTQPVSASNPLLGLVELGLREEAHATAPCYSAGFRWAINPRWTLGGAYQSQERADMNPTASLATSSLAYYDQYGLGSAPSGIETPAAAMLSRVTPQAGTGRIVLPSRAALGLRHRMNQRFTWEADLHYIDGASLRFPTAPSLQTPNGVVTRPGDAAEYRSGYGASLMGELSFAKDWTVRMGLSLDPALLADQNVEPMVGGARCAAFSGGVGYRIWGGELNFGYQFRQSKDQENKNLDGSWSSTGYRTSGTATRVEGMGHLLSIGFRKSF